MVHDRIETAKAALGPARTFLESRGVEFTHDGRFRCPTPEHVDNNPSAKIDRDNAQRWRCWSCGAKGDVLDLYQIEHGVSCKKALEQLVGKGIVPVKSCKLKPLLSRAGDPPPRLDGSDLIYMQTCADDLLASPAAIIQHARWRNWNRKTILHLARDRSLGISEDGRLAFLYMSGVKYRNLDGRKPKVHWRPGGKPSIWRIDQMNLANPEHVIIAEGETDVITLVDEGVEDSGTGVENDRFSSNRFVIALPSAGYRIHPKEAELFRDRVVIFYPDADHAGQQCVEANRKILSRITRQVKVVRNGC
jgi:hypothetical protein